MLFWDERAVTSRTGPRCSRLLRWGLQRSRTFGVDLLTGLFLLLKSRAERLHFIWDQRKQFTVSDLSWQSISSDMKDNSFVKDTGVICCHGRVSWESIADKTAKIKKWSSISAQSQQKLYYTIFKIFILIFIIKPFTLVQKYAHKQYHLKKYKCKSIYIYNINWYGYK